MRTLRFILQKEFKQIFRNRALLPIIFVAPILQLLILPLVADYEIKNLNISVIDYDHSPYSQKLIHKIDASKYFTLVADVNSFEKAWRQIEDNTTDLVLEIPRDFEKNLLRALSSQKEQNEKLLIAVNAINGVKGNVGGFYLQAIIRDYNNDIRLQHMSASRFNSEPRILVTSSQWFNPRMNYRFFMVPGILVVLVTLIGTYMCALNIVKEKETGTIEQINVTPIKKYQFILGKLIPFWLIGIFIFSVGLFVVARLIYGIVPVGNLWLLYGYLLLYLIALLGFGLLISTYSETQQQAMSIAFFFMIIFILMSGLFTSIESMPSWAYFLARSIPVTYFIEVVRMIILKGSSFTDIKYHFFVVSLFSLFLNIWAIINYKKTI